MNRALRIGDRVEFRASVAADEICRSPAYPELGDCMGESLKWDETEQQREMTCVSRRIHQGRPVLDVELSWTQRRVLVWAIHMRLDNRAMRNRYAAKIEAMKAQRLAQRLRRKRKP